MMKPVVQLERTGCGIASVAALAGVSYTAAKHVANRMGIHARDSRLWSETTHMRQLLRQCRNETILSRKSRSSRLSRGMQQMRS